MSNTNINNILALSLASSDQKSGMKTIARLGSVCNESQSLLDARLKLLSTERKLAEKTKESEDRDKKYRALKDANVYMQIQLKEREKASNKVESARMAACRELEEFKRDKETLRKLLEDKEKSFEKLDKEKSIAYRSIVTCKTCRRIFMEPVDLACSHTICKSHLNDFNKNKCQFCQQYHEIVFNDVKSNTSVSETIEKCLHLTESEKEIKMAIEKLLSVNKSLTEELCLNQAESETLCYDHFAKILNGIDLQREELKKKIDELSEYLIEQVKQCKSKFQVDLKTNESVNRVLNVEEIIEMERGFVEDLRKFEFPKETLENLKNNLDSNCEFLNNKLSTLIKVSEKILTCRFLVKNINFGEEIFGDLTLV